MTVVTAGDYRLFGDIFAASGLSDSAFVTVNGTREPADPDYWQMSQNNTYEQQYLTSRTTGEESILTLIPGDYVIRLHQRDDGVQWDRVGLELLTPGTVNTPTPVPATNTPVPPPGGTVNLQTGNATVDVGASTEVDLTLQSGSISIGAFTIDLTYDASVFVVTGCQPIDFQVQCNVDTPGQVQLTGIDANGISGNSLPATITITGLAPGTSDLTIADVPTLADSAGVGQSYTAQSGQIVVNAAPQTNCGPLQQEAEDGTLAGNFAIQSDATASGGQFVSSTSGVAATGPDGINYVSYCMTVPTAGLYRIAAKTFAATLFNDSFYVQVDGMPSQGYLWGMPVNTGFVDGYVSDRGGMNPVEMNLSAGDHEVVFWLRESGTKLDKVALELVGTAPTPTPTPTPTVGPLTPTPTLAPPIATATPVPPTAGCSGLQREAEDGELFGDFVISSDAAASGGQYVSVENGIDEYNGPNSLHRVDYCFTVADAGTYKIKANVYSQDNGENSLYVRVDNQDANTYRWNTPINTSYDLGYVTNAGVPGLSTVSLTPGEHTVSVYLREIKTRLDTIALELDGASPAPTPTPPAPPPPPPPPLGDCGPLQQEAEAGTVGNGDFVIGSDSAASGGQYIHVVNGPDEYDGPVAGRSVEYCFDVQTAGNYVIQTNVYGQDNGENSFYVQVNSQPLAGYRWNTLINTSYDVDYVSNAGVSGPVILSLTPGQHTVTVYVREIKSRLDTIALVPATQAVLLAADANAGPPRSMGAHGSVYVLNAATSKAVDPDDVDFTQFSMTLVAADGTIYTMPLDYNGYYRFDDLPVGDYLATLNTPEGYGAETLQEAPVSLNNEEVRRIDPDVVQNVVQDVAPDNNTQSINNTQSMFLPFVGK